MTTDADRQLADLLRRNPQLKVRDNGSGIHTGTVIADDADTDSPTEHAEQVAVTAWVDANADAYPDLCMFTANPMGGFRTKATAGRLKAEGVRAGVPDMMLLAPRTGRDGRQWHGLFIELKRADRSNHASAHQKLWLDNLRQRGYMAVVCYGATEAIATLKHYLEMNA